MNEMLEQIEAIKEKIQDQEYLNIMSSFKKLHDKKEQEWDEIFEQLCESDQAFGVHFPMQIHMALETKPGQMVQILARALDHEHKAAVKMQSVLTYMATIAYDTKIRHSSCHVF